MEAPMGIDVDSSSPNALLVLLEGEFDISERDRLNKCFETAAKADVLVLNFAETTYIDSSVLHVLCALQSAMDTKGSKLILIGLNAPLRRLFEVMRLDTVFDVRTEGELSDLGTAVDGMRTLTLTAS